MKAYPHLCEPLRIGGATIKNRMCMAPMDTGFGSTSYGGFTPEGVEYFVRRAKGGFGLLFTGGISTDPSEETILDHRQEFIAVGRELNERVGVYGAKMFAQLSFGVGRNGGLPSPSPLPALGNPSLITRALTVEEIHAKIDAMAQAALLCKQAGFSGVDVHAMHWGHLLDSFALAFMNRREDDYGGTLENRIRVAKEIVEAVKGVCGEDFPVTIRLALKSYMKGFGQASFTGDEEVGRTPEEAVEIARLLESYGYDALSTDAGTLDAFYYAMPPSYVDQGYTVDMAARVKRAVSIPVLCGARMANPDLSEQCIAEGSIDAAVVGRQAIADPDYANKVFAGRPEEIRTCIGCNQGCIWGYFTRGVVGCAVNPQVGHELAWEIAKAPVSREVVVVGGGVAGMEAARVASLRGHRVTLYEESGRLGGNLIPAGAHDFKSEVAEFNAYYAHQMDVLGVDVRLGVRATPELLRGSGADAIVLAVGSTPVVPKVAGVDSQKVMTASDALLGGSAGDRVVVVGGGLTGCETAYGFAREGKRAAVVEALDELMVGDVPSMNRAMLLDAFDHYGVDVHTGSVLEAVAEEGAVVRLKSGATSVIPADTVVLSIGYRPRPSIARELVGCGAEVYEVGDGSEVGNVLTCIRDAYEVARCL